MSNRVASRVNTQFDEHCETLELHSIISGLYCYTMTFTSAMSTIMIQLSTTWHYVENISIYRHNSYIFVYTIRHVNRFKSMAQVESESRLS